MGRLRAAQPQACARGRRCQWGSAASGIGVAAGTAWQQHAGSPGEGSSCKHIHAIHARAPHRHTAASTAWLPLPAPATSGGCERMPSTPRAGGQAVVRQGRCRAGAAASKPLQACHRPAAAQECSIAASCRQPGTLPFARRSRGACDLEGGAQQAGRHEAAAGQHCLPCSLSAQSRPQTARHPTWRSSPAAGPPTAPPDQAAPRLPLLAAAPRAPPPRPRWPPAPLGPRCAAASWRAAPAHASRRPRAARRGGQGGGEVSGCS